MALLGPLVLLLTVLLISFDASAQLIQACVKQNGNLRIVGDPSECRRNETPLSWNQQGEKGDKGDPGEPGPAGDPATDLRAFDGAGTDLGPLVSFGSTGLAFYDSDLRAVITYSVEGSLVLLESNVFFDDALCEGQPYFNQPSTNVVHVSSPSPRLFIPHGARLIPGAEVSSVLQDGVCVPTAGAMGNFRAREVTEIFNHPSTIPGLLFAGEPAP